MEGAISRLIYVDDSGDAEQGWVVYGWVEVHPRDWNSALRTLLELRKELWRDFGVPPSRELHATHYANGRGKVSAKPPQRFSAEDERVLWKDLGQEIAVRCLQTLRDCERIRTGAIWERTPLRGPAYKHVKARVYRDLVRRWSDEHRTSGDFALVSMDGDGSDRSYFDAHRALPLDSRHVIEDPMFHDSKRSQWVQFADLVAFSAYAHVNRHPRNAFAWHWHSLYLT